MADHSKVHKHHQLAGKAIKAGDMKTAAHHMGHAMSACRACAMPGVPAKSPKKAPAKATPEQGKLRGMLARFRTTGGAGGL